MKWFNNDKIRAYILSKNKTLFYLRKVFMLLRIKKIMLKGKFPLFQNFPQIASIRLSKN